MKLFKHYLSRVFRPIITLAMTVLRSILCSMKKFIVKSQDVYCICLPEKDISRSVS